MHRLAKVESMQSPKLFSSTTNEKAPTKNCDPPLWSTNKFRWKFHWHFPEPKRTGDD